VKKNSGVLVLGLLGAAGAFFLYPWYRNYRRQVQEGEQALNELHQFIAESSSLATLGDINIDPTDVTLKKLNQVLQRPPHAISGRPKNSKSIGMGWACGGDLCTVEAFFLASSGGQVPPSAVPITLWISNNSGFGKPFPGSIGGIHLGDTSEKLLAICAKNGYKQQNGADRISWNKDWDVRYIAKDDKITSLFFFNMTLMNSAQAKPVEFEEKR
jgi:hypothetical protein